MTETPKITCIVLKSQKVLFNTSILEESGFEKIKQYEVQDFFEMTTYQAALEAKSLDIPLIGIFYKESKDGAILRDFFEQSKINIKQAQANLYYYPKPHSYFQTDSVGLFCLFKEHNLEKLLIEILHKQNILPTALRNKAHGFLAESLHFKKRRITLEGRLLSNLSSCWELFEKQEATYYNLVERITEFYPAPIHINLGTINRCNLKCSFCFFFGSSYMDTHTTDFFKEYRILDEKIVYDVMDYAAAHNCIIDMVGPCEMLLDKRVPDFIKYGKNKGVRWISMTTNGLLLDEEMQERVLDSSLDCLSISIDAHREETYKQSRGGDFKRLIKNVESFLTKIAQRNIDIYITLSIILKEDNKQEVEDFKKKWSSFSAVNEIYVRNIIGKENDGLDVIHHKNFIVEKRYTCQKPWDEIHINPDGGVMPCCTMASTVGWDNTVMGNLYKNSLEEIWANSMSKKMRQDIIKGDFSFWKVCNRCEEWSYKDIEEEDRIISPSIEFIKVN